MLVLTRKINEAILIGKSADLTIHVLNISENQVKIGITAPQEIPTLSGRDFSKNSKRKTELIY